MDDPAFPSRASPHVSRRRAARPLDPAGLEELALAYVGRFATSRAKLARYLDRKLFERGWAGDAPADVAGLVDRMAGHRYVDDAGFAEARARSLARRGYGARRIDADLRDAGIADADRQGARQVMEDSRLAAALRLAERKRWGPFAARVDSDPASRERKFAAFLRAGHSPALARAILALRPGDDVGTLE